MSKGIILETYIFVGGSDINKAKLVANGKTLGVYKQTEIIETLGKNRSNIKGGIKIKVNDTDPRAVYLIYFGGSKNEPKQFVKVIFNKNYLDIGDVNALAIEDLCIHSILVRKNKIKTAILNGFVLVGLVGTVVGTAIWAGKEESKQRARNVENYQRWLQQQQMENGTYSSVLAAQRLLGETTGNAGLEAESSGRSY